MKKSDPLVYGFIYIAIFTIALVMYVKLFPNNKVQNDIKK